jgi:general transcription factor IIIA
MSVLEVMDIDSDDDDYERVEVPSDSETNSSKSSKLKNSSVKTPPTPATSTSTPYCREKRLICPYEGCDKAFNRPGKSCRQLSTHRGPCIP